MRVLRVVSAPREGAEEGAALITSVFGVGIFLTFLLTTVQVVLYLFTATVVQAAAVDGASHGAGAAQAATEVAARERAGAVLGRLADDAAIATAVHDDVSGQVLTVSVEVELPSVLGRIGLVSVQRDASARVEQ